MVGQRLYNGITLSAPWPPRRAQLTLAPPPPPPYLASPPAVIPIDWGRQLFVDDSLTEHSTLRRTYHRAFYHPASPVLRPDRAWGLEGGPTAMVFSDGVWYDPRERLFKLWYMGGYGRATCYATSRDGLHWDKRALDVVAGTNIVLPAGRDSATVWLDFDDPDPQRRYKLAVFPYSVGSGALDLYCSADGIHWQGPVVRSGLCGDRSTAFYNPFRRVWVYSLREGAGGAGTLPALLGSPRPASGGAVAGGRASTAGRRGLP
jgi:hypothetical protein